MTVYYLGADNPASNPREIEPIDGDYKKVEVIDPAPDGGMHFSYGYQFKSGRPIKSDNLPKKFLYRSKLPVQDYETRYGMILVSSRFREIIEEFEPGVHQFFPIEYVRENNIHVAKMWMMVVCKRLDSVDREHTTMKLNFFWSGDGAPPDAKLIFNEATIDGHHIWCDKHLMNGPLVSSALGDALTAAGLSGLKLFGVESL